MDIDYIKLKEILELLLKTTTSLNWLQLILFILVNAIVSFFAVFFGAYAKRKAINVATVEDIGKITKEIEEVKNSYKKQAEVFSESLKLSNQLKLAAIDKKLETYQEAYTLWIDLMLNIENNQTKEGRLKNPDIEKTVEACHIFWEKKCLYLSNQSRLLFNKAYRDASAYTYYRQREIDKKKDATNKAKEIRQNLKALGKQLTSEVGVYFLSEEEYATPLPHKKDS